MKTDVIIKKIKYLESADKIVIEYERRYKDKNPSYHISTFSEKAAPEFYEALEKLIKPACNILGLGALFLKRLKPHTVSYKYSEDGTMSAAISCLLYSPRADKDNNINVPLMRCPADETEAGQAGFFTQEEVDALWKLETEARKYLDGKRNQIQLWSEEAKADAQTDEPQQINDVPPVKISNVIPIPTIQ